LGKWNEKWRNSDGKFLLKIVFPGMKAGSYNKWKQTSNPMELAKTKKAGVVGY